VQPEFVFILGLSSPPKQPTIGKATPDFHTLVEADKECFRQFKHRSSIESDPIFEESSSSTFAGFRKQNLEYAGIQCHHEQCNVQRHISQESDGDDHSSIHAERLSRKFKR